MSSPRPRHVPQRTCIACRQVLPKRALTRIVRAEAGVDTDETGKLAGRGAYLHNSRACWEKALKGDLLERALKTTLTTDERERLRAHGMAMPDEA